MRKHFSLHVVLYAALLSIGITVPSLAEDTLSQCYSLTEGGQTYLVTGADLRSKLLNMTQTRWRSVKDRYGRSPSGVLKMCSGSNYNKDYPSFANIDEKTYYGVLKTKKDFLEMAAKPCAGPEGDKKADHYFSIGHAIFYRDCHTKEANSSNDYLGYIYFWGRDDGVTTACFSGSYPAMFKVAGGSKGVSVPDMEKVFDNTGWTPKSRPEFAFSDAMSAIQIAEASRDWLVYPLNYMLIDLAKSGQTTPEMIIGGHCPAGVQVCRNTYDPADGAHPLAWGGAKISMMCPLADIKNKRCTVSYTWGRSNGATNSYGQAFETDIIVHWLSSEHKLEKAGADACKVGPQPENPVPDETFKAVFP